MRREDPSPPSPPPLRSPTTIASPSTATGSSTPPPSPRPMTRSEPDSPCPPTFVQAEPSTFKQVVQMLTGFSPPARCKANTGGHHSIPPLKTAVPKKPGQPRFRLYERRSSLKKLSLKPLVPFPAQSSLGFSPRKPKILSPSLLHFPSLSLSPVTPLLPDPFSHPPALDVNAEERAIKEKGFFLHRSPRGSATSPQPRLLPLFPLTSS